MGIEVLRIRHSRSAGGGPDSNSTEGWMLLKYELLLLFRPSSLPVRSMSAISMLYSAPSQLSGTHGNARWYVERT